ncbi:MAG: hypothetical protein HKN04_14875, partial [Rhodothermaceae bacterium]|nr:hypothetical protein [Rhodothermaceae bacterium]
AAVPDESPVAFSPMEAEGVVEDDEANAEGAMPYEDEHETPGDGERSETDASEETGTEAVPRTEEPPESSVQQEKRMPEEDEGQPSGEAEDSGHDAAQEEPTEEEPTEEEPLWKRLARQQGQARSHEVPEDEGEDEPLWKRLAQQEAPLQRLPAPSDAASSESPTADIETTQEDILDVEVVDIEPDPESGGEAPIEPTQAESLRALETRILGPTATERRDWYIQHLTGGSEAEYRVVLGRLDQATTWTQATQIIGADIFRKHQVNIYSDAAIAFTDAVEAYFRS